MHVASSWSQIRCQPRLQLSTPHTPQGGGHHNQQRPVLRVAARHHNGLRDSTTEAVARTVARVESCQRVSGIRVTYAHQIGHTLQQNVSLPTYNQNSTWADGDLDSNCVRCDCACIVATLPGLRYIPRCHHNVYSITQLTFWTFVVPCSG